MDSHGEYTSDIDYASDNYIQDDNYTQDNYIQDDIESFTSTSRRKAVENPIGKPNAKKIRVNFSKQNKTTRKAYVWKYFEEIGDEDICKIIVLKNNKEVDCGKNYK